MNINYGNNGFGNWIGASPIVVPVSYPAPAYPYGVINGQQYDCTMLANPTPNGVPQTQLNPYIEFPPQFIPGYDCSYAN